MVIATELRQRAVRKRLRVTFPDGRVICHKRASDTFMEVIRTIPTERLPEINIVFNHKPLITQVPFRDGLVVITEGWYMEGVSDTDTKFRHLLIINNQLSLGLKIEIGEDFETTESEKPTRNRKKKEYLSVTFPDGTVVSGFKTTDTFVECIKRIGVQKVAKRDLKCGNRDLITSREMYNAQVEVENGIWLSIPNQTTDKYKILKVINNILKTNLEISII